MSQERSQKRGAPRASALCCRMTHTVANIHINEIKKGKKKSFELQMAEHKGGAVKRWGWRFPVAADFQ